MESRVPREEYVKMAARQRVRTWKWWFVLLLLLGLIAGAWAAWRELAAAKESQGFLNSSPIYALALLQVRPTDQPAKNQSTDDPMRPFVMIGILTLIAIVTLVCLGVSLFSTNASAVSTASDLLKRCIGFFIGIVTGYFGQT